MTVMDDTGGAHAGSGDRQEHPGGAEHPYRVFDRKWQKYWADKGTFRAVDHDKRPKSYVLNMFPYPSGDTLHMGHTRTYIIGDVLARLRRMKGFNVLNPMGWDAFGMPAENAAIKALLHPAQSNKRNIATMKRQFTELGISYDWSRELSTDDPAYYRWTQWIFLKMHEKGLTCRRKGLQNWCPSCATVLANEQVEEGKCWRCSSVVEKKELEQWFIRITAYADRLLDDLKLLDKWPERVKVMQENWIGRSEGARIVFKEKETGEEMPVFTTRPDTLFGVTFMVIAPEHPALEKLLAGTPGRMAIQAAANQMKALGAAERTNPATEKLGVFTGRHVTNPANGDKVPVYIANYALMDYGTGAVMGVPAHDQRDFLFAKKYGLAVKVVIRSPDRELDAKAREAAYEEPGVQVNSGPFDGLPNTEAIAKITAWLATRNAGGPETSYHLRDWVISRQRYWGAPIPIVHCERCGVVPVPYRDLPVRLPEISDFRPKGMSPLAAVPEFVNTRCPKCSGPARRETDTIAQWLCSCWYFLRYLSPHDADRPFDRQLADTWLPVDQYVGGVEHAVLHLLYTRFIIKVLHDAGEVSQAEPFKALFTQGMITRWAYRCPKCNSYVPGEEVHGNPAAGEATVHKKCGSFTSAEMAKMSKGWYNVIAPDALMDKYGADTQRLYTLFIGPPERDAEWNDAGVAGASRFIHKLWDTAADWADQLRPVKPYRGPADARELTAADRAVRRKLHQTIRTVTADIEQGFRFNTAIAAIMECLTVLRANGLAAAPVRREALEKLLLILGPFIPHVVEELWTVLGNGPSVFEREWPGHDPAAAREETLEIPVQVNGKLRGKVVVPAGTPEQAVREQALAEENVRRFTAGKTVAKVVYIPGRLLNVVVK